MKESCQDRAPVPRSSVPAFRPAETRQKLPIGIQTFAKIGEDDCYYVDKTGVIRQLLDACTHYVLSRPCRFGKSLLLDTLGALSAGHEALFRGLAIHPHWD